jgi:hypothetical protein
LKLLGVTGRGCEKGEGGQNSKAMGAKDYGEAISILEGREFKNP